MRRIVSESGALEYARKEINALINKAGHLINSSKMQSEYKESLLAYSRKLLNL
jgi:geranylgeranyl pyrophosphate synthase